ncbi:hypothetical protein AWB74_01451 [Caballeronia arvi]|uniref:Tlde1 domain-containing protein n=1 Tax=Caballeronia arvi TaxID=1777135 RepID=A0A158GX80_9BURK|nr:DUF2778 domain-containing protein [Caballeronia arvi]SAL36652.1 hypothetical protein AWB74_01451 [Caballeronia arvi]
MPVNCTFLLNRRTTSTLSCSGFGDLEAYSGQNRGRDNPDAVAVPTIGPLPKGTYFIVDRQSGGMMGWAHDLWSRHGYGTTDRTKWFMLWNPRTGDYTMIDGVRREAFRLHPEGPGRVSKGCITVTDKAGFERLQRYIRNGPPLMPVPGSTLKAYGTVQVR